MNDLEIYITTIIKSLEDKTEAEYIRGYVEAMKDILKRIEDERK